MSIFRSFQTSIFKIQICYQFLSPWRTKRTSEETFIIAEIDHPGDPYQRVKLEILYWFVSWTLLVIGELLTRVPRSTLWAESFRSRMLHGEAYLSVVTAAFAQGIDRMKSSRLPVVSDVHIRSWEVLGVVIQVVKVNTVPPRTTAVTGFIRDQDCVETVTVTHMKASFIYIDIIPFYALMCVWSFRL